MSTDRIAADLSYTGYTTLTVLGTGEWFSPSDVRRTATPEGVKEFRYEWGRDEEGAYCYCPTERFVKRGR